MFQLEILISDVEVIYVLKKVVYLKEITEKLQRQNQKHTIKILFPPINPLCISPNEEHVNYKMNKLTPVMITV